MDNETLLKILACPACHGELALVKGCESGFLCEKCQVVYPIKDDIPIMIINEAIPLSKWEEHKG